MRLSTVCMIEGSLLMDWEFLLAGVVSLALLVYLVYSLLYPEKF